MKSRLLALLKLLGKSDRKVAAVFGSNPESCHAAVVHLREGASGVPVWLFATVPPLPETSALCERVCIEPGSMRLFLQAEAQLWKFWVALSVAAWTGGHGKWPLKLAPFLIPPFRALILNGSGDFFAGTPGNILLHWRRGFTGASQSLWNRTKDISRAVWLLVSFHVWRSGPVTRVKDLSRGAWVSPPVRRTRDIVWGVSVWAYSVLMRWCGYPDRVLFRRWHGNEPLELNMTGGSPAHLRTPPAVFVQKGPKWDGLALEKLARASDARWILWCEKGGEISIDDMRAPFLDERTFAVSMQWSFRDWKPMLFASTAFRTLQPGEASRVLAPVASAILVDREKLLAVGIPHASLPGTAWLLIFWKAAAAGWRSYRLGQAKPLKRQPDFPMQERAFILRVLLNRSLKRLAPRDPDLTRGSISFAPALQSPLRKGRLTVLLLSPFLPFPLSHGGAVRIYNLCRALKDRVDFILVAIREKQDVVDYAKIHEIFREVYVVDKDERASRDKRLPLQVREHESRSLKALVRDLSRKADLVQIEYTHLAAFRDSAPGVPAILVEHDLTFTLYRQLAESRPGRESRREYERWLAFEKTWLNAYDGVWTVSEEDRETAIREGNRTSKRTFNIANGVDTGRFLPLEEPTPAPEIFYVGSFRHLPNILGFEKLRRKVMPKVWARFPEVRLRVVAGPRHEEYWRRFTKSGLGSVDPRVEIHGFVEDLRPLYAKASVVAVSLEVSAGTNIKVLEAMACGKAIVTTPVGCAGLGLQDGYDVLIRADWTEFAAGVCEFLSDPLLRSCIAQHARRTVEERFSWTAIADSAYRSYQRIMEAE